MKVRNMAGRTGKGIVNQFVIEIEDGFTTWEVLQSYQETVAIKDNCETKALSGMWDYSVTTAKYVAKFLNMSTTQIRSEIKAEKIMVYDYADFKRVIKNPNETLKFS